MRSQGNASEDEDTEVDPYFGSGLPSTVRLTSETSCTLSEDRRRNMRERIAYRRATRTATARTCLAATTDARDVPGHALKRMNVKCTECEAIFWVEERKPTSSKRNPIFEMCCKNGSVKLPEFPNPPPELLELLEGASDRAKHFRNHIRAFNSAFGFTSSGASFDRSLASNTSGVYTYRVQGAVYHLISDGLLPGEGQEPGFAQIYIFDTDYQISRRSEIFPDLDRAVIETISHVLERCNHFVEQFSGHNVRTLGDESTQHFELRVGESAQRNRQYDAPTGSEVAILLLGAGDEGRGERSIVLRKRAGGLQFVNQLDERYDPLHYVLLFPFGNPSWSLRLKASTGVTMNQFYRYHFMVRESSRVLQLAGRLTQEYVVDAYAKIEESRLMWIRCNQATLRANLYQGLQDQAAGDENGPTGRMIILPPSFTDTAGPRYMQALYQDAMAIVRKMGKPDLFITMTCNPKWPEITKELLSGQKAQDRFDLCCRVFHLKLKALLDLIIKKEIFGKVKGRVYVIEFQKRGLPHAHMLWILEDDCKPKTPDDIDRIVCAEIPDPVDRILFDTVTAHMIHGPCGVANRRSPCMKDDTCSKKYPKLFVEETHISSDGYPLYKRRNDGRTIMKRTQILDNRSVVPYNKYLVKVFNCHINVEVCSSIQSVKYLYKYLYKGHDRIQARVVAETEAPMVRDEPQRYLDARYVSASESFWRICEFSLQKMYPSVLALQVHDKDMQSVTYSEETLVEDVLARSKHTTLTEWMRYNREHPHDQLAARTLYCDFPSQFTWSDTSRNWSPRQRQQCIGRVHFVSPRDTTRYYLRLLLHHVPGATCFKDLRTVNGVLCETYQGAAQRRGLLESDQEFDNDLQLAAGVASPRQIRELFAMMLMFCELSESEVLLEKYMRDLGEDFMHAEGVDELNDSICQQVLSEIESILYRNGSTFANFPTLPQDVELPPTDMEWEISQSSDVLPAIMESDRLSAMLNGEQRALYDAVVGAVESSEDPSSMAAPKVFFVDGLASRRQVIATATSGIAALLLEGGRTLHSAFKVPIPITHLSTCSISPESRIGRQIMTASLIIVDEALMMHRHIYEAIDRTFRDIMRLKDPRLRDVAFGGKVIVMGGDFRQMLPVIPKGSCSIIVNASLNRSPLWRHVQAFKLKINVRVAEDQVHWSEFLLFAGEGIIDSEAPIHPEIRRAKSLPDLISAVYGQFEGGETQMTAKTILTPLSDDIVKVNDMVLDRFPGEVMEYRSADIIPLGEVDNVSLYPTEFLNTIDMALLPLHKLRLKIGQGAHYRKRHMLPRIALYPSQSTLPFSFKRLQFPVRLAFVMTIKKAQGQTLDIVGLYLPNPLFAHGQLYVTLSRTRSGAAGIIYYDEDEDSTTISNVVFKEVL